VEKNAYRIPSHVSFEEAAMVEPLACVIHGIQETAPRSGDIIMVLGLGPIGLMFIGMLKHRGCIVLAAGRHEARLQAARDLKADHVFEADSDGAWIQKLKKWPPIDMVIEATGRPEVWQQAIQMVRRGGTVNLFGGCPSGTSISLDTNRLHYDQITIKSSFHHRPSTICQALDAISFGTIKPKQFISDQKSLHELPMLFTSMIESKKVVKTCILPAPPHEQVR
jgi:L-iditol 2-dehydrogenase